MGTNTDPYQKAEGKYHLTRGLVEALGEAANPFSILTKSTLVLRDLDVLTAAAERTSVRLNLSIGTLDREVWKLTEPGTPPPDKRVEAVRRLNEAGIPCGVLVAPVLPGLSDGTDQLREVVEACVGGRRGLDLGDPAAPSNRRARALSGMAGCGPPRPRRAVSRSVSTARRGRAAYQPKAVQEELSERVRRIVRSAERHADTIPARAVRRVRQRRYAPASG